MTAIRTPVDAGRFRALAEAYGGDLSRWPEGDREAASAWLAANPREAAAMLDGARALDDLLGTWRTTEPAESLRSRVLAPAPALVRSARRRAFVLTLGGGAGLAAACLVGILVAPSLLSSPVPATAARPAPSVVAAAVPGTVGNPAQATAPADIPTAAYAQTDEVLSEVLAVWEAPVADTEVDSGA